MWLSSSSVSSPKGCFSVSFCFDSKFSFMSSADIRVAKMQDKQKISPAHVFFFCLAAWICFCLVLFFPPSLREEKAKLIFLWRIDTIWQKYSWREKQVPFLFFSFFCLFIHLCLSESPCSLSFFPSAFVLFSFYSFLPQFKLFSLSSSFSSSLSHFILKNSVTFTDTKVPYKVYLSIFYLWGAFKKVWGNEIYFITLFSRNCTLALDLTFFSSASLCRPFKASAGYFFTLIRLKAFIVSKNLERTQPGSAFLRFKSVPD